MQVRLRTIRSIEVWRDTWTELGDYGGERERQRKHRTTVNYVLALEQGVIVPRGIQASINTKRTLLRKIKSFEWRAFPALTSRLTVDKSMNHKLLEHLNKDLPEDLHIRRLSDDRWCITTSYKPRRLPSREALRCIEDIATHVSDFVTEWNKNRESEIERELGNSA